MSIKKFLILIGAILISAVAVSAQAVTKGNRHRGGDDVEKRIASGGAKERGRAALVLKVGPSTTYLKNGLSLEEVLRLLGQPASVSERHQAGARLATYTFARSEGRALVAEFSDGVLVSSRTENYESLSQNRAQER